MTEVRHGPPLPSRPTLLPARPVKYRSGAIAELTVADVEAADAGYVFSPDGGRTFPCRGRGFRIPRLEELLVRWPEECINIDPKSDAGVAPLVDLIERLHAWDRCATCSTWR
jgi:glycerophosphoryl diester phosphodiesterase